MRGRVIKNICIVLLCFFFIVSGRILLSIGTDSLMKGTHYSNVEIPVDPAQFFKKPGSSDGNSSSTLKGGDWGESPFRNLDLEKDGLEIPTKDDPQNRKKGTDLRLEAISLGNGKAFAVINGKALAPGEAINGYKVKTISLSEVVLEKEGRTLVLTL